MNSQIDKIQTLTNKANDLKAITDHAERLERELKAAQEDIKTLSEQELPELMNEIGMQQFKLQDGTKFEVKPVMVVNLPKDKTEQADEWLDNNGHSGLVKTVIAVPKNVPREVVEEILSTFKEHGYEVDVTKGIHWQTLQKWSREMEEEGYVIPEEIFTVYRSQKVAISR